MCLYSFVTPTPPPCSAQSSGRRLLCHDRRQPKICMSSMTSNSSHHKTLQARNFDFDAQEAPCVRENSLEDVKLILAPMEVLADFQFRGAIATIGGMHEAVHEFIRITDPKVEAINGLLRRRYAADEMGSIPLAAQIMGGDPAAMGVATGELVHRYGAHRVDLNCGCPAKRVNGRGAGASLLRSPESVYAITKEMVDATAGSTAVVSVKMRSGYESTTLFEENIRAIVEAGARMLTVHPRTKTQRYSGSADWDLIRRAKEISRGSVEIVGNGDVTTADDALRMLDYTGCDHVMVGRGAVSNPWIFWEIREAFARRSGGEAGGLLGHRVDRTFETERIFYENYFQSGGGVDDGSSPKTHKMKIGRLKMIMGYSGVIAEEQKRRLLRSDGGGDARRFFEEVIGVVREQYEEKIEG